VPLKHFFDFRTEKGISQIYAENGELVYRLYANLGPGSTDAQMAKARADAKVLLERELQPPEGYSWTYDNSRQDMDGALSSLFIALAVSILLMYVLLAWQFDSLVTPLIILVTIPLGLIGVLICLKLFGSVLNLNSLLGTILLGGIVVNNAIIMIDFYENAQDRRADPYEALLHAAGLRFQPILITTLTTIIGMLPLAIGMGGGSDILKPLGIAVSGGLTVSTLLALFAVPALIRLRLKGGEKRSAKREKA
jgi:HAE1 family hydrophobic/amphiphilic exporter-1